MLLANIPISNRPDTSPRDFFYDVNHARLASTSIAQSNAPTMSTSGTHHGSCHCGNVQYQIKLTFPPIPKIEAESIRIYKCNCSTCHKMGMFHCRPINITDDFIMTSPSTIEELGDYRCFSKKIGWYFCKNCGVRVFGMGGEWEQVELDVEKWAGKESDGKLQKAWRSNPYPMEKYTATGLDGKTTRPLHYLSVNAVTLEGGEGGVDLKEWHENGWVFYVNSRDREKTPMKSKMRFGEPHDMGMY